MNAKLPVVVNLRHESYNIYIGRENGRYKLKRSIWYNPYKVCRYYRSREEANELYKEYILYNSELLARLPELSGRKLGCWCKPESCHGDIFVELFKSKVMEA